MRTNAELKRWLLAGLLAGSLWAFPAMAEDASPISDQDRSNFNTLYGEKLSSVNRTRSTTDDKTLIDEMFSFAMSLPDKDAGVKCLIHAQLIDLSAKVGDIERIRESLVELEAIWPTQDLVSSEVLMQLASRAYRVVDRSEKQAQGEHYIELLFKIAMRYESEDDHDQALGVCRLASTIARSIGSDQLEAINDKLGRLAAASDLAKRITMLKRSVEKNPQNSPAARELVDLLITEQNDINAAADYVESTRDEELIDLVQRCAKGIDKANAATAMRIGDWYIRLAENERDEQALELFHQSRKWYEQFFALYRREDALAKRAAEMDNLALLKIERLLADNPVLASQPVDGWFPQLAPPFDADAFKLGEPEVFDINNNEITLDDAAFYIPFDKAKAYEVRVTLTVHEDLLDEQAPFYLYLPLSDSRYVLTRYYAAGETLARVDRINEKRLITDLPDRTGQKIELTFQIAELNGQVAFAMLFQGKAAVKWQGELEELDQLDEEQRERLPEEVGTVMLLRCFDKITLHAVDYKKRD